MESPDERAPPLTTAICSDAAAKVGAEWGGEDEGDREGVCAPLAYFVISFTQGQQRAVIQMKCTGGRVRAGGGVGCGMCAPHQLLLTRGRNTANPP